MKDGHECRACYTFEAYKRWQRRENWKLPLSQEAEEEEVEVVLPRDKIEGLGIYRYGIRVK